MATSETVERFRREAEAMKAAVGGECLHDTFYARDWADKPHRVVYDAVRLIREAADIIEQMSTRKGSSDPQ